MRISAPTWARTACGLAISTVAVAAGWISYSHIYELTIALGGSRSTARLMPFSVDGMITVGSVVLLPDGGLLGWAAIIPGTVISVFANVESGLRHGALAATWAGMPAVSFFVACLILERWRAKQARKPVPDNVPAVVAESTSVVVPESTPDPVRRAARARAPRLAPAGTPEHVFAAEIRRGELPTFRAIKTAMRVGTASARDIRWPAQPGHTGSRLNMAEPLEACTTMIKLHPAR
jgi:hypothetical protein